MTARWRGIIGFEGVESIDGRRIEPEGARWELPIPLRNAENTEKIGTIDAIERRSDGALIASGTTTIDLLDGEGLAMNMDDLGVAVIDGVIVFRSGRVRYVYITHVSAWLEARVLEVTT